MRLGSGIAPVRRYLSAGLTVGLGVDGSASNDSSNLLAEIRMALLLSRVTAAADGAGLTGRMAIELATRNSAQLLGRTDIGSLAPGRAADFIAICADRLEIIGSEDPIAAIAFCSITAVDHSWVHGRPLVRDRKLVRFDLGSLIERMRTQAVYGVKTS
jgi:cytosine/adenosine deaminase-related metal-dependent hydrolase